MDIIKSIVYASAATAEPAVSMDEIISWHAVKLPSELNSNQSRLVSACGVSRCLMAIGLSDGEIALVRLPDRDIRNDLSEKRLPQQQPEKGKNQDISEKVTQENSPPVQIELARSWARSNNKSLPLRVPGRNDARQAASHLMFVSSCNLLGAVRYPGYLELACAHCLSTRGLSDIWYKDYDPVPKVLYAVPLHAESSILVICGTPDISLTGSSGNLKKMTSKNGPRENSARNQLNVSMEVWNLTPASDLVRTSEGHSGFSGIAPISVTFPSCTCSSNSSSGEKADDEIRCVQRQRISLNAKVPEDVMDYELYPIAGEVAPDDSSACISLTSQYLMLRKNRQGEYALTVQLDRSKLDDSSLFRAVSSTSGPELGNEITGGTGANTPRSQPQSRNQSKKGGFSGVFGFASKLFGGRGSYQGETPRKEKDSGFDSLDPRWYPSTISLCHLGDDLWILDHLTNNRAERPFASRSMSRASVATSVVASAARGSPAVPGTPRNEHQSVSSEITKFVGNVGSGVMRFSEVVGTEVSRLTPSSPFSRNATSVAAEDGSDASKNPYRLCTVNSLGLVNPKSGEGAGRDARIFTDGYHSSFYPFKVISETGMDLLAMKQSSCFVYHVFGDGSFDVCLCPISSPESLISSQRMANVTLDSSSKFFAISQGCETFADLAQNETDETSHDNVPSLLISINSTSVQNARSLVIVRRNRSLAWMLRRLEEKEDFVRMIHALDFLRQRYFPQHAFHATPDEMLDELRKELWNWLSERLRFAVLGRAKQLLHTSLEDRQPNVIAEEPSHHLVIELFRQYSDVISLAEMIRLRDKEASPQWSYAENAGLWGEWFYENWSTSNLQSDQNFTMATLDTVTRSSSTFHYTKNIVRDAAVDPDQAAILIFQADDPEITEQMKMEMLVELFHTRGLYEKAIEAIQSRRLSGVPLSEHYVAFLKTYVQRVSKDLHKGVIAASSSSEEEFSRILSVCINALFTMLDSSELLDNDLVAALRDICLLPEWSSAKQALSRTRSGMIGERTFSVSRVKSILEYCSTKKIDIQMALMESLLCEYGLDLKWYCYPRIASEAPLYDIDKDEWSHVKSCDGEFLQSLLLHSTPNLKASMPELPAVIEQISGEDPKAPIGRNVLSHSSSRSTKVQGRSETLKSGASSGSTMEDDGSHRAGSTGAQESENLEMFLLHRYFECLVRLQSETRNALLSHPSVNGALSVDLGEVGLKINYLLVMCRGKYDPDYVLRMFQSHAGYVLEAQFLLACMQPTAIRQIRQIRQSEPSSPELSGTDSENQLASAMIPTGTLPFSPMRDLLDYGLQASNLLGAFVIAERITLVLFPPYRRAATIDLIRACLGLYCEIQERWLMQSATELLNRELRWSWLLDRDPDHNKRDVPYAQADFDLSELLRSIPDDLPLDPTYSAPFIQTILSSSQSRIHSAKIQSALYQKSSMFVGAEYQYAKMKYKVIDAKASICVECKQKIMLSNFVIDPRMDVLYHVACFKD